MVSRCADQALADRSPEFFPISLGHGLPPGSSRPNSHKPGPPNGVKRIQSGRRDSNPRPQPWQDADLGLCRNCQSAGPPLRPPTSQEIHRTIPCCSAVYSESGASLPPWRTDPGSSSSTVGATVIWPGSAESLLMAIPFRIRCASTLSSGRDRRLTAMGRRREWAAGRGSYAWISPSVPVKTMTSGGRSQCPGAWDLRPYPIYSGVRTVDHKRWHCSSRSGRATDRLPSSSHR